MVGRQKEVINVKTKIREEMHRLEKLYHRECLSSWMNFAGKQKKNTPLLHMALFFFLMCYHKYCLKLTLPCQTDSVLAVAQEGSSFKLMLAVKNILKRLIELVCPLFCFHYCVRLYCLFKFTVLLFQSYLLPVKSGNTTWINTTRLFRLLRHANRNFSEMIQIF